MIIKNAGKGQRMIDRKDMEDLLNSHAKLKKENIQYLDALEFMLNLSDTWGREWFPKEIWDKIQNIKTLIDGK